MKKTLCYVLHTGDSEYVPAGECRCDDNASPLIEMGLKYAKWRKENM